MIQRLMRRGFAWRRHAAVVRLTTTYAVFAVLAIALNLGVQRWVLQVAAPWASPWLAQVGLPHGPRARVLPALVAGTAAGLVLKYFLDKRFIFADGSSGAAAHVRKFSLYALMGVATTVIFWASELLAAWVHPGGVAVYIGGGFGLVVGYLVKYRLDRRWVFMQASTVAAMQTTTDVVVAPPQGVIVP